MWQTSLTPGGLFGGEIGSAALVDGKLIAVSNHAAAGVARVFGLDPATGEVIWEAEPFPGRLFAPVGAVRGVAFVGTDAGTMAALDTRTGAPLWSHTAPARTGCGPSIVDGRVLWGYGFTLFSGPGRAACSASRSDPRSMGRHGVLRHSLRRWRPRAHPNGGPWEIIPPADIC